MPLGAPRTKLLQPDRRPDDQIIVAAPTPCRWTDFQHWVPRAEKKFTMADFDRRWMSEWTKESRYFWLPQSSSLRKWHYSRNKWSNRSWNLLRRNWRGRPESGDNRAREKRFCSTGDPNVAIASAPETARDLNDNWEKLRYCYALESKDCFFCSL